MLESLFVSERLPRRFQNSPQLAPPLPEWSCHLKQFYGFVTLAAGDVITTAELLEEKYDWENNPPSGRGGAFADYRFVKELGSKPLFLALSLQKSTVDVYWNTPQKNCIYTLEQNYGVNSNGWPWCQGFSGR